MTHIIRAYLHFLWNSKNQYGLHSPFAFNLATKCFYDYKYHPQYAELTNYRKAMLQNHHSIEVTDYGAGSRVFKSNTREVSKIASHAGISAGRAKLLCRLVNYFGAENILEIGTSVGLATSAMALANNKPRITTIEGCDQTSRIAQTALNALSQQIVFEVGEFDRVIKSPKIQQQKFDLIYFDGNHEQEATLQYFNDLLPSAHNDSVWIFDDIHWSTGMEAAWEAIKQHSKVTVTIDTFHWGLVFFRREQAKENFIVRV